MPQGPVKASHEFSVIRRASSLESIPTEESRPAAKVDIWPDLLSIKGLQVSRSMLISLRIMMGKTEWV
jgi:hypothetical protein